VGGLGRAVGEWESLYGYRQHLREEREPATGHELETSDDFEERKRRSRFLVRFYSTQSAYRRKILYALLDFLALHKRTGERRADGLSLSAPLTQKHISCSYREATVGEDFKRSIRAKGANWRISPLFSALGFQTHVCLCPGASLALSSGCFSSSSSSSMGKGFLFCMAVILSKGARGIRRLFMDYIVWQAECETAYLRNLLKVISWLIFLRANLATLKGTTHLHIPQKNVLVQIDYLNVIRRFMEILQQFHWITRWLEDFKRCFLFLVAGCE